MFLEQFNVSAIDIHKEENNKNDCRCNLMTARSILFSDLRVYTGPFVLEATPLKTMILTQCRPIVRVSFRRR